MKNFKFIPYDKKLVSRARELRKETTKAEEFFWEKILKNRQLANLKFTRQKPIGHFILDFYCASLKLAVEIDGDIHIFQQARDIERDNFLKQNFGLEIVRYTNEEVLKNIEKVAEDLMRRIQGVTPP